MATLYRIKADGSGLHRLLGGSAAKLAGHRPSTAWPALSPDGRQVAFQSGNEPRYGDRRGQPQRQQPPSDRSRRIPDLVAGRHEDRLLGPQLPELTGGGLRHALRRNRLDTAWRETACPELVARRDEARLHLHHPRRMGSRTPVRHECRRNRPAPDRAGGGSHARMVSRRNQDRLPRRQDRRQRVGPVHVYVINANGTNLRRLPPPVSYKNYDCGPAWSPNGKQIAFTPINPFVDRHGSGGIYLMNPDGRHVAHLKGTSGAACGISWRRTPA